MDQVAGEHLTRGPARGPLQVLETIGDARQFRVDGLLTNRAARRG